MPAYQKIVDVTGIPRQSTGKQGMLLRHFDIKNYFGTGDEI